MNTTFVKEGVFAEQTATIDLVLEASFLSDAQKEAILGGILARLLRIPPRTA